jgi:hypothetical protein
MANINVQTFNTSKQNFFILWLTVLQPFLKLRDKEVTVLGKMLHTRYLISLEVRNPDMLDELLFSSKIRKQMQSELKMEEYAFNNILTSLRGKKMVLGRLINKKIIPVITEPFDNFKLSFNFDIKKNA